MKRVMVLIMLLLCINTYGQLYQAMPQPGYGPVKRMWIDSVLIVPTNVTSGDNLSGGREVGKIRYNITDSSLQAWTGYQWRSGGSGTTPTWQQTLTAGSTLTGNNTIAGGGFNFTWNNAGIFTINASPGLFLNASSTGEVVSQSIHRLASLAGTVESTVNNTGDIYYNSTSNQFRGSRNGAWTNFLMTGDAGAGTVTSIATTSPITGGTITTTGTIACPTCVTSAAALTANSLMIGGGLQASSTTTTASGILTWIGTPSSANLRAALTDENGTGAALFEAATTPSFTTGIRIGGAAASRKMLVGNGTNFVASTETWAVPGTSGNVLTSDGTNWISAAPAGGMAIGGSITSATEGSVLFAGASGVLAQDNSNLFWDNTNKRLAIGSTTTTFDIDVRKTTDGSVGFGVQNASGGTSAAAVFQLGRSYGADYYVSHYYAGDGNAIYTPLSYNIINASGSTGGMNLVNIANASMTFGTSNTTRMTISGAGAVRMHTYGAGAATFDASGNITSVSDIRLKNKQGNYSGGLKELMKINPIIYKWKPESGMETKHDYIGFSAQNIRSSLGEDAIGINKQGYLSIQDRAILAVAINAIQELKELNDKQQKEIDNLKQIIKNK